MLMDTAELYNVPTLELGVLPSVVYLIEAPDVVVVMVTLWVTV